MTNQATVNYYTTVNDTKPSKALTITQLIEAIKYGIAPHHKDSITAVRQYDKNKIYNALVADNNNEAAQSAKKGLATAKMKLPAIHFTFNSNHQSKKIDGITKDSLSGYYYFDIDNIDDLDAVWEELSKRSDITALWHSCTNTGLGGLIRIDWMKDALNFDCDGKSINAQYKDLMLYVWAMMGLSHYSFDEAALKLTQVNYLSIDDKCVYNADAVCLVERPVLDDNPLFESMTAVVSKPVKTANKAVKKDATKTVDIHNVDTSSSKLSISDRYQLDRLVSLIEADEKQDNGRYNGNDVNKIISVKNSWMKSDGRNAARLLVQRASKLGINPSKVKVYMKGLSKFKNSPVLNDRSFASNWMKNLNFQKNWLRHYHSYSPQIAERIEYLEKGQYLSNIFHKDYFTKSKGDEHYKVIIDASTGIGKNVAVVKNARLQKTIIVVPKISLMTSIINDANNEYAKELAQYDKDYPIQKVRRIVDFDKLSYTDKDSKVVEYDVVISNDEVSILDNVNQIQSAKRIDYDAMVDVDTSSITSRPDKPSKLIIKCVSGNHTNLSLSDADIIITTQDSLSIKVVYQLMMNEGVDVYNEYLLVVDELHTVYNSQWRESKMSQRKPITELLLQMTKFKKVIAMTGTHNSTPLNVLKDFNVLKVRYKDEAIKRKFTFIRKIEGGANEDLMIMKDYTDKGYYPIIYKNNTDMTGWLGRMINVGKESFNYDFAILNSDAVKNRSTDWINIGEGRLIPSDKKNGVIMTAVMGEGTSTNIDAPDKKVVFMIYCEDFQKGIDADSIQQISARIRNVDEVLIVMVYKDGFDFKPSSFFNYQSSLEYHTNIQNEQMKLVNSDLYKSMTPAMRIEYLKSCTNQLTIDVDGDTATPSDLYLTQAITESRMWIEYHNPEYMAWLANIKYDWEYMGQSFYNQSKIVDKVSNKLIKVAQVSKKAASDAVFEYIAKMYAVYFKLGGASVFNQQIYTHYDNPIASLNDEGINPSQKIINGVIEAYQKVSKYIRVSESESFDFNLIVELAKKWYQPKSRKMTASIINKHCAFNDINSGYDGLYATLYNECRIALNERIPTTASGYDALYKAVDLDDVFDKYDAPMTRKNQRNDFKRDLIRCFYQLGSSAKAHHIGEEVSMPVVINPLFNTLKAAGFTLGLGNGQSISDEADDYK